MERKNRKLPVLLAAVLALTMLLALTGCSEPDVPVDSATALKEALAAEGIQRVSVDEDIILTETLVVNGEKTLVGTGRITLSVESVGEETGSTGASVLGCPKLTAEDMTGEAAVIQVSPGAVLTLGGSVVIDCVDTNGILVQPGATVELTESATVQGGRNCGIYVCENAVLNVSGGNLLESGNHGIVNMGTVNVTGGKLSGTDRGAVIYSAGTLEITGGVIAKGGVHNVYVAAGSVDMTGGKIEWAAKDGLVVAAGVTANVTGGTIENCGTHGLCNSGTMETGAVTLIECGIANNSGGTLNMVDTTVDISAVYCLANLGGTVTAKNFSALGCDVTSICNFAGDMTLENLTVDGSRAGCISNESGNLTVNGATLGLCREKPINVGSGVVRMDNVTVEGTTGEYFGAYIYGGEFYLSNSSISYINYSALRADGQCYVELNNVTVDDTMASGIWARGATIVANNLTLNNIRGHALNNSGGNLTVNGLTATDIGKNAILQNNGTTVLTDVSFLNVGDQGAYVENGSLTIQNGTFENIAQNGVYSRPDGQGEVYLEDVKYTNVSAYGLNNGYKLNAKNVTIRETGEAGILNKREMTLENVEINGTGKDCIYNDTSGVLVSVGVRCYGAGASSNPVYNRGRLYVYGMWINGSHNHGLRNVGIITGDTLEIANVNRYGIYNQEGNIEDLTNLVIRKTGDHAINNMNGMFEVTGLTITEVLGDKSNAIYNTGSMTIANVSVDGGKSHAIFNRGRVVGTNITITNCAEVSYYNYDDGYSEVTDLTVANSGNHAVCNVTNMKLTNLTVNGTVKGCGLINGEMAQEGNSGKTAAMELNGTVVIDTTASHGVCNVQASTLTGNADVTVSNATGNGVYNNASTMTLCTVSIDGAKYGFSNSGTASVSALTVKHTLNNAIHSSNPLTVNGNLVISDVNGTTNGDNQGNGIYNTNTLTVNGKLSIDSITASGNTGNSSNNAIFNRGTLKVTGDVTIGDVKAGHAIIGTAGTIDFPGTMTVNGTVGKDNIIYFYSGAKSANFGKLIKTSDVDKVILKVDGSTQCTVAEAELVGKTKDVVVANGSAVITLSNVSITGGNNALHGAGGDIVATNLTVSGSTIGINIRNANSEVKLQGDVQIGKTSHGSAVHVNSGGKLTLNGANVSVFWADEKANTANGMKIYKNSTLEMVGSSLTVVSPKTGFSIDAGGKIIGDAASSITVTDVGADGLAIESSGTIEMNGTVSASGADSANPLYKLLGNATFGQLNKTDSSAREVLAGESNAQITVNGGALLGGSGKDAVVARSGAVITLNNVTIEGGNNALFGSGGDIIANNVTVSNVTIGVNIRHADSQITIGGSTTFSNATHGSVVHVNLGGKLTVNGAMTVNCNGNQNGFKVYKDSTLELIGSGSIVINDPKTGINTDAGASITGEAGTSITVNNTAASGFAIENYGIITMNGTVSASGAAGSNALFKMMNNAAFGVLNRLDSSAREVLRAENSAVVNVYGGVLNGGTGKDVVVAAGQSEIHVSNLSVNGGNNMLYGAGGDIYASDVTLNGGTIGVNIRNANSEVTMRGNCVISNTTHGTCMHINSKGKLTVAKDAKLTLQWTAENLKGTKVGLKIYANSTLVLEDNASLTIVDCSKGWNTETGHTFTRGENVTVTVNGSAA